MTQLKNIATIIILFFCVSSNGQNYQCLQYGVKHYFLNGNNYLRGITIDSVTGTVDSTIYYPFHTPRGAYSISSPTHSPVLDTNGGSWLGKKVIRFNDGTFIFDSYWNDSVVIRTQAHTGDSWTFFRDTSSLYYTATVTSEDTMTFLSSSDSVKTIKINAYNPSGLVTTDPLNGFSIILSKNNGFIQVFDLYTFPYHKPDSAYRPGLDFFLDRSSCTYYNVNTATGSAPNVNNSIFKLVNFINPNDQQLHNWNIGDIIESYHEFSNYPVTMGGSGVSYMKWLLDTVSSKTTTGHATNYVLSGNAYSCSYYTDPCDLILNAGSYTFYDTVYPFADISFIPEEKVNTGNYVFYYPNDTSHCTTNPVYVVLNASFLSEDATPVYYKLGIGETSFSYVDDDDFIWESGAVVYTNINGVSCANLSVPKVNVLAAEQVQLYPNPANDMLTIKTNYSQPYAVSILNAMGQTLQTIYTSKQQEAINVSNIPAGVYNVCVLAADGSRVNNKVVIEH